MSTKSVVSERSSSLYVSFITGCLFKIARSANRNPGRLDICLWGELGLPMRPRRRRLRVELLLEFKLKVETSASGADARRNLSGHE